MSRAGAEDRRHLCVHCLCTVVLVLTRLCAVCVGQVQKTRHLCVHCLCTVILVSHKLVCCVCAEPVQVKKRGRRNKNRESRLEQRESELEFMAETFLQQLHSLPSVPLREPDITILYSIVPIKGGPSVSGNSQTNVVM